MNEIDTDIRDYLTRYASTLTGFDAPAAAELWATPAMIIDDRFTGVLSSRDEMVQGLERSYPLYRRLGLASVGFELLSRKQLTDAIVMVRVRWRFHDVDGVQLTDSSGYYILRRDEGGLRACVCVQTDDVEKITALAAERGIDLSA